jgi:D-alanyl-D-alanine carboxypeptidase
MKFCQYILIVICLLFIACTEEFIGPENDITCNLMFDGHSKNEDFQSLIDNYTLDGFVGLTLLVDSPEDGLWIGSSGLANIEENEQMNPCHIHHTASLYKTFIATIILQFENEGKLKVDDKLSNYISSEITDRLPNGSELSIKNLLQHRSGIPDIFEIDFILDFFNNQTKEYSVEELLEYVYDLEPLSAVD